jgi:hypothetical protein
MLTSQERAKIFNQKKQQVKRRNGKNGLIIEKVIPGFVKTTIVQFEQWYDEKEFLKGCYYCGTTNEISNKLYLSQRGGLRPDATRGGKRGRRLELDRKDPNLPYDRLENIVWCCYWCNNAKSNFFTEEEFKPIAVAIGASLAIISSGFAVMTNDTSKQKESTFLEAATKP